MLVHSVLPWSYMKNPSGATLAFQIKVPPKLGSSTNVTLLLASHLQGIQSYVQLVLQYVQVIGARETTRIAL